MDALGGSNASLESVAHIIQVALTPVFLLAGLANLLAAFSTRLGRVADRVDRLSEEIARAEGADAARLSRQLAFLVRRSILLDVAVVLGALGGGATCAAVIILLVGFLYDTDVARLSFLVFGGAVALTILALNAFLIEMLMAGMGLRAQARFSRDGGDRAARRD